jgi:hypothetical protein
MSKNTLIFRETNAKKATRDGQLSFLDIAGYFF